ncbi:MAG: 3-dehydroquinate synthase family protein [Planctomycetota bacterium]
MHPACELPTFEDAEQVPSYPILVGDRARLAWKELAAPFRGVALLADATVWDLHGAEVPGLADLPRFLLPSGESSKDWQHLGEVLGFLADADLGPGSLLLTLGGGVVSDLGGLAASIYKRGMAVAHMPSTLLAQVDASVGGKTAVNLPQGKNLVGTYHMPAFVLMDPEVLRTLPIEEWRSGLGEVCKTALLARRPVLHQLEDTAASLSDPTKAGSRAIESIVRASVRTKAQWVEADPTEKGCRKALNLGHTFAHAIEHAAGFGTVPHGIAVAFGLQLALRASADRDMLFDQSLTERIPALLGALGLPRSWRTYSSRLGIDLTVEDLMQGLAHDKKGDVRKPRFVLPLEAGRVVWDIELEPDHIEQLWRGFLSV